MKFKNLEYYAAGLLLLVLVGFWPSYFSKFFDGSADFTFYFHFHTITAALWIVFLIVQPLLIRTKRLRIHRLVGKCSYLLVPMLYISILLLAHHRQHPYVEGGEHRLWIPFKDLIIFGYGYLVAICYRKEAPIHARGMVIAGMALIEPTMARIVINVIGIAPPAGYILGISIIYVIIAIVIVKERKATVGRWVFPGALCIFAFIHTVVIFRLAIPGWKSFAEWFLSLPLT
ncbi:MAG: hypothetical protein AB3N63_18035 [Puniceicoccaceae bacterium]